MEQQDGEIDLRVLIHHSLAGCVIGKSGSKIKELREVSEILSRDNSYLTAGNWGHSIGTIGGGQVEEEDDFAKK